jgi:hypothetical protein
MQFPTISTPTYEVKLLSREKPVKFRPFLVKEQKLMLLAVESKDPIETIKILKQVASNCILDDDIDLDSLSYVDLEVLFLNFRARSMGEVVNVFFKCKNEIDGQDKPCGMIMKFPINLLEVPVVNGDLETRIMIDDNVGIQMKIPSFEFLKILLEKNLTDEEGDYKTAAMCIEYIFDKDNVYYAKDATLDELINFLYNLPPDKYAKIERFFQDLPKVKQVIDHKCPKCSFEHKIVLEGLSDFFI